MKTREMRVELATFTGSTVVADDVLLNVSRVPECLVKMKRKHFYGNRVCSATTLR